MLLFVLVGLLLSCKTNDPEEIYSVTLKLDSSRIGKFDSVRVEIYNGKAPGPGDTAKPVQVKTIPLSSTAGEFTVELSGSVEKDFSVVVTGFDNGEVAYRKLHTVEGFTAPDDSRPPLLLVTGIQGADLDIKVGETRAAILTFTPSDAADKRAVLRSLDSTIVRVIGDSVKGVKTGTATVMAVSSDPAIKAGFTVTVNPSLVPVTGLSAKDLSKILGETFAPELQWTPEDADNRNYTLASKDTAIVRVRGDSMTALSAGEAEVVARSESGGIEATFSVTVKRMRVAVTGLSAKDLAKFTGDTFVPELEWTPSDADNRNYTLVSEDTAVVRVRGDSLSAVAAGEAEVIATSVDGGKTAAFTVTVEKRNLPVVSVAAGDIRALAGDTLDPVLTWTPENASDKGFVLRSLDSATVKISGSRMIALVLGEAEVEVASADGGFKDVFTVVVEAPEFKTDVLPITKIKCAPCHVPGTTLNFQDSLSLLLNGAVSLDRLERASGDPNRMPVKDAPNGDLTSREREILLEWLNARIVRLKNVKVADATIRLGETKSPDITWDPANATNKSFTLTSLDTAVVEVSGEQLTGKAIGLAQAQLRALEGGQLVTFKVNVVPIPVDSISISDTTATIGDTIVAVIRFHPSDATNQAYSLTKFRTASAITTVLPGKRIVANAEGKDTLVATSSDGSKVRQFTVTVGPVFPTAVSSPDTNGTAAGPLVTPRLVWVPANTTNKGYTLSIAPGDTAIAAVRVGREIQVQGKTVGNVNVTITSAADTSVKGVFKFTVGPVPVISLSAAPITTYPGLTLNPVLTWNPSNATTKTYTLTSPDTAKVKIVSNRATTVRLGAVNLTVTSVDGGKTAAWNMNIIRTPFTTGIRPLLVTHCGACHNSTHAPTNWADSATAVLNRKEMVRRMDLPVAHADHMPPSTTLPPADLAALKSWLSQD